MLLLTFIYKNVIMGKKFFLIWIIFKVCIELVAILFLFYIFVFVGPEACEILGP